MEALLTRKAGDLRRGVLSLLLAQPDVPARSSARRLLAAKDPLPRSRRPGNPAADGQERSGPSPSAARSPPNSASVAPPKRPRPRTPLLDQLLDVEREDADT